MMLFENAFRSRLAKTNVGNKNAKEIFIAAMEAEYRAKQKHIQERRKSILQG